MSAIISIIIPSYNYGQYILTALTSIKEQNDSEIEIIIIDDGSQDNTASIIQTFQINHPTLNLRYIHQNNQGAGAARNHGIYYATGRYLLMLDADDYLLPKALWHFRQAIIRHPNATAIMAGHASYNEKTNTIKQHPFTKQLSTSKELNFVDYLRKKILLAQGAILYHRSVFDHIHYPESVRNAEDISVFFHILATQICISLPTPVMMHRKHQNSLRHQWNHHQQADKQIADLVFDPRILPEHFFKYYDEYCSSRYLSLSRIAYQHKHYQQSIHYYQNAIYAHPAHLCRVHYFKRYLLARLKKIISK